MPAPEARARGGGVGGPRREREKEGFEARERPLLSHFANECLPLRRARGVGVWGARGERGKKRVLRRESGLFSHTSQTRCVCNFGCGVARRQSRARPPCPPPLRCSDGRADGARAAGHTEAGGPTRAGDRCRGGRSQHVFSRLLPSPLHRLHPHPHSLLNPPTQLTKCRRSWSGRLSRRTTRSPRAARRGRAPASRGSGATCAACTRTSTRVSLCGVSVCGKKGWKRRRSCL